MNKVSQASGQNRHELFFATAQKLIREQLLPAIEVAIAPLCKVDLDSDDPHTINIEYPVDYPVAWAAYDSATLRSIRLMPADAHLSKLQEDYRAMREMIFGKAPDFDTLLQTLEVLQQRIHSLNTTLD